MVITRFLEVFRTYLQTYVTIRHNDLIFLLNSSHKSKRNESIQISRMIETGEKFL